MYRMALPPSCARALSLLPVLLAVLVGCSEDNVPAGATPLRVVIENVAAADALETSSGPITFHLPPGVWLTTTTASPLYALGEADRGRGLEALAEDGDAMPIADALVAAGERGGVFAYNSATYAEGAIDPGQAFALDIDARDGDRLHLASMLGESNDIFFATDAAGIPLFADSVLATGDVTSHMLLIDLGTEVNQPIGEGADQAPRQSAPNTGAAEGAVATEVMTLSASVFVRVSIERR